MRNRGIELFLPDSSLDAATASAATLRPMQSPEGPTVPAEDRALLALGQPSGVLEPSSDLELLLASEGVPGAALRRDMAAAHLAVVRSAAEFHRYEGFLNAAVLMPLSWRALSVTSL
jgi:hypothetical protein